MYRFGMKELDDSVLPWDLSFENRYQYYVECIEAGKKVNLYFYERADSSTFRYRVYNVFELLRIYDEDWKSVYFFNDEIKRLLALSPKADIFTVARIRWCLEVQILIDYIKKNNFIMAFDIDDLVFNVEDLPVVCDTSSVDLTSDSHLTNWFGWFSRMNETAKQADVFITTNNFLADRLLDYYQKPAYVIRNFMNKEQLAVSDELCKIKDEIHPVQPFCIGYFSGSYSHNKDFESISPYLDEFMARHEDVILKIVGHLEICDCLRKYEEAQRVLWLPYMDFRKLQKEIASVDINVIPLIINDFTNCKSELKYYEASIVNTVSCASKTYIYNQVIEDKKSGYLCEGKEWLDVFERIYQNRKESQTFAKNAKLKCLTAYYGDCVAEEIINVYNSIENEMSDCNGKH